jgi:hypothetical protein
MCVVILCSSLESAPFVVFFVGPSLVSNFFFSASVRPNKPANIMSILGFKGAAAAVAAQVGEAKAVPFILFVFVGVAGGVVAEVVVILAVAVAKVVILVAAVALFLGFPRSFWISCIIKSIFVTNSIDSFGTIRGHACVHSSSLHFKNKSFTSSCSSPCNTLQMPW